MVAIIVILIIMMFGTVAVMRCIFLHKLKHSVVTISANNVELPPHQRITYLLSCALYQEVR